MENLILLSDVSFNSDILETNIINIAILVAVLFNAIGGALKASMLERKEKILNGVQDAEQRLQEASERLLEAKTQLNQSKLIINKIKTDKDTAIRTIALNNRQRALEELERQANSTKLAIIYKEQQILRDVKEHVSTLALTNVLKFCQEQLKLDTHVQLINKKIESIGGQKWQAKF